MSHEFNQKIKLGSELVGLDCAPLIVAEMSGNHNQSLDRALAIVKAAHKSGAQAFKLQTYTADTLTIKSDAKGFVVTDPNSLWVGKTLYELYEQAHTPWEWHAPIFELCHELGMLCFSTPFDETSLELLESLSCPFYKIASFENAHLPLIEAVAKTGKPVIVSTGMATLTEIQDVVDVMSAAKNSNLILLKCTSSYPSDPVNANITSIPDLKSRFGCLVGLSDHSVGIGVSLASVALGASVIERHFTLDRVEGGVDAAFSLEPVEFAALVKESRRAYLSLGSPQYGNQEFEASSKVFRRSIYIVKDLKAGDELTPENIRIIRPGWGLIPKMYQEMLGKTVIQDVKRGTPLSEELIDVKGC